MNTNTAKKWALHKRASIWDIEISDLGACKPFLGYSLTDQYILVGITAPDAQNEVAITSIPDQGLKTVHISLSFSNFEYPCVGGFRFSGLKKISGVWNVRLLNSATKKAYPINDGLVFSIENGGRKDDAFLGNTPSVRPIKANTLNTFVLILSPKSRV